MIAMKTHKTFPTRIDLASDVRGEMIELLNQQLADTFDLYSQTKQAHWNVKGTQFYPLHELFDKLAVELEGYADLIAERATALGGLAQGTVRLSATKSQLAEFPLDVTGSMPTVEALAERYAVWTGIGAVGTALVGMLVLNESRDWLRLGCIGLIILGVVGLKAFAREGEARFSDPQGRMNLQEPGGRQAH